MAKLDELHNYAYPDKYLDELHIYDKKIGNNSSDEIHYYGNRGITYGLDEVHLYGSYQTVVEEDEINKPSEKEYEVIDIDEYFDEIEDLDEGQKEIRKELANEYKDILELILMMILAELKVGNTVDDIYYKTLAKSRMMNVVDDLLPNITIDIYSQIENYIGNNIELVIDSTLRNQDDPYFFSEARATTIACDDSMATVNLEELDEAIRAGYKYKIWMTMRDNRVRHTHEVADGQKVKIQDPFKVGRCKMQAPLVFDEDTEYEDAKEIIRCRCYMIYSNSKNNANENKSVTTHISNGSVANSMPEDKFQRIKERLEQNGISVIFAKGDDLGFLDWLGAEATYDGGVILHRDIIPSASAFFEEIIHSTQAKIYGELSTSDGIELTAREIEANRMMLKYGKYYGFTEKDFLDVEKNLKKWENNFEGIYGVSYDESGYFRGITH